MEIASLNLAAGAVPEDRSGFVYVGWGTRAGARILDMVLHFGVSITVGVFMGIVLAIASQMGVTGAATLLERLQTDTVASKFLAIFGFILYTSICEGLFGSTAGKYITGLVVLSEDGAPASYTQAVGRSFAFLIDGLFFGLIAYSAMKGSPRQQRNGDKWANTVVVTRASAPPDPLRKPLRFLGVLVLAVMLDALAIATGVLV